MKVKQGGICRRNPLCVAKIWREISPTPTSRGGPGGHRPALLSAPKTNTVWLRRPGQQHLAARRENIWKCVKNISDINVVTTAGHL